MGGEETEVTDETTEVLLEAANFEPLGILASSERLALRTAGSNRWEKGVDPYLAEPAAKLASRLIVDLAGARMTGSTDVQGTLPERPVVRLRPERASALIGLDVPPDEQRTIARRLRVRRLRRLGRDGADLARARRHARDRPDRGGRAAGARPRAAHDAEAAPRPRAPEPEPAAASARRGRARRRRALRGVHVEPRGERPEPRRDPASRPDDRRTRPCCGRRSCRGSSAPCAPASTSAQTRAGSSRSPGSTCRRASSCRRSAGASAGSSPAATPRRRASSRRSTTR